MKRIYKFMVNEIDTTTNTITADNGTMFILDDDEISRISEGKKFILIVENDKILSVGELIETVYPAEIVEGEEVIPEVTIDNVSSLINNFIGKEIIEEGGIN